MIYIEFKNKTHIGFKKVRYARVLARVIKEMRQLRRMTKHEDPEIEIDYKIIFK